MLQILKTLMLNLRDARKTDTYLPPGDDEARAASYPPPYPDGWYKLADSAALGRGQVRFAQALGQRWVVFRSDVDGSVGILDATCPHQGANLAAGTVRDGCLECPFHGWRFATNGRVLAIPYTPVLPQSLRARSWPVCEFHGQILVYYSSEGAAGGDVAAAYELEPLAPLLSDDMVFRGSYDYPRPVRMHLIEFAENSADFAHFAPLHGRMHIPWTPWRVPLVTVRHAPVWESDPERPHVCYFYNDAVLAVAGRDLPTSSARASITFLGPGGVTIFRIALPKLGEVILFHTHTPRAPLEQDVQFRWYADRRLPRLMVSYIVGSWIAQWHNDIAIWENKFYRERPKLVPGDGPVFRMRRWFKQFYPVGNAPGLPLASPLASSQA